MSYLEVAKKTPIQKNSKRIPFDVNKHFNKISEFVDSTTLPDITNYTNIEHGCYTRNSVTRNIIALFLKDPTKKTLNMFYAKYKNIWRDAISSSIIHLQKNKDYRFYEAMDNNTLLHTIDYCIYNKEYHTFKILFKKLKSGFYTIFYNIMNTRDIYLMTIFSELSRKYYVKMLNTRNVYGNLPLDTLMMEHFSSKILNYDVRGNYSEIICERIKSCDMQLFVYMAYAGASSEMSYKFATSPCIKEEFHAKLFKIFAPQVAEIMHRYLGYENDYKKLHNTDLVFNKILSYLVVINRRDLYKAEIERYGMV